MSDAQTLSLIEALERRVANLEILEDPIRVTRLINDIASDAVQDFTLKAFTLWDNSEIALTLAESGYLWWGYQFTTRNLSVSRDTSFRVQTFLDGVGQGLELIQGQDLDRFETAALVGRSDDIELAGAHTVDVRIWVENINDIIRGNNLTGYAFWTRE